jgi:hypothetical protein
VHEVPIVLRSGRVVTAGGRGAFEQGIVVVDGAVIAAIGDERDVPSPTGRTHMAARHWRLGHQSARTPRWGGTPDRGLAKNGKRSTRGVHDPSAAQARA